MRPPPGWAHALVLDTQGTLGQLKRERHVGAAVPGLREMVLRAPVATVEGWVGEEGGKQLVGAGPGDPLGSLREVAGAPGGT